jgi:ribosomal protein L13
MKYTLDAQNKGVGRVATQAAALLLGKNRADFAKNKIPEVTVEIKNTSKAKIDPKKMSQKT